LVGRVSHPTATIYGHSHGDAINGCGSGGSDGSDDSGDDMVE